MEREIKFRGKSKNTGDWLYGVPVKSVNDNMYLIHSATEDAINTFNDVDFVYSEVIPETVGQFTTLKDKNGVEIYEGDIIEFVTLFTKDTVVEQVWIDEYACLNPFFDPFYVDDEQGAGIVDETIKVLGNIHDKHKQKQALIDMMRGDEELGLYDDNPKNH